MASATKEKFSNSTDGRQIVVAATATPGTNVHTSTASNSNQSDEIWLWASSLHTGPVLLTMEIGSNANVDLLKLVIPSSAGDVAVIPGTRCVQNSTVIRAVANVANVVNLGGFVNRINS